MERVNLLKYISHFYFSRQNPVSPFFFENFYHSDHLGTPRVITNKAGEITAMHKYYPYGEEITSQTQNTLNHKFTGHERDFESNLDYMHARYYHQFMRRFLSPDKTANKTKEFIKSWNLFAYANNNPIYFVDSNGKEPISIFTVSAIGSVIALIFNNAIHIKKRLVWVTLSNLEISKGL